MLQSSELGKTSALALPLVSARRNGGRGNVPVGGWRVGSAVGLEPVRAAAPEPAHAASTTHRATAASPAAAPAALPGGRLDADPRAMQVGAVQLLDGCLGLVYRLHVHEAVCAENVTLSDLAIALKQLAQVQ